MYFALAFLMMFATLADVPAEKTREQMLAAYDAHKGDFDYLIGDWEFTSNDQQWGKGHGVWSAFRVGEEALILDEYRVTGDNGETFYVTRTLRSYNPILDRWELVSTDRNTGLQNIGIGHREGGEMHIEQNFGVGTPNPSTLRIRYYDIQPDRFSWVGDRSTDGGKTWTKNWLTIEARRIGPARSLAPLTTPRKVNADASKK